MTKRIMCLLSVALVLGLVSAGYAEVIDSFETGVDAWEIMDPAESLAQAAEGVTDGAFSMQRNFVSGWHEIDLGGVSVDALNANDILEVDVTTSVTAEQMGWWLQQVIVLQGGNAAGSYYIQSEVVDVASPDGTLTTTTVSFDYRSLLADGPLSGWAKIRLIGNTGPGPNGVLYYDNLRMVSTTPPPATVTIGDFEGDLDGWWERDATLSFSTTGATLGTQALQVDGPGDWHQNALMDLKPHRDALASAGATITADVTAFDADLTTTWMNVEMIINGQNNDDNGANNNIGWQSLGSLSVTRDGQPNTYTWVIPDALRSAIGQVDDSISWFELVLVTNLDGASVTKFYIDNIQLSYEAPPADDGKSTDTIIGDWEQDMDGWVVGGGADALFNDHNGVTLGDYSLDVYVPNGDWNQDVLTLNVIEAGLLDVFKVNRDLSADVTRLLADFPTDQGAFGWNGIHVIINAGGDGWSIWQDLGYQAHWLLSTGDLTQTAVWNYGQYLNQIDFDNVTWLELKVVSNANDAAYTGWVLFYLDNMKLSGAGGALDPQPADAARDVPIDTTLSWTPGTFAATHHLYLGTDWAKVSDADMDSDPNVTFAVVDTNSFDPGGLEFKTQYYWRIDEVNEDNPNSPWTGEVLNFVTADFLIIDDFESYNDINPGEPDSNRILETWTDGWQVETNGALVGNDFPPYADQTTVQNGAQSMPFYYDNSGAALQSETQRVWAEPQIWMTSAGTNTLKLYTYGAAGNTAGELYVIIEDSSGVSQKVVNTDSTIFTAEAWTEWAISLNDVAAAGVNLAAVKKLVIGIADLPGQAEAKGVLYVDDIRRYPPVVVSLDPDHLVVPKTAVAPIIDGVWDAVWNDVSATECLITDIVNTDSETPENAADLSAVFKAFYDDTNFYIFVEVQDSLIDHEFSDWQGDGIEFYFDGDYSHGESYDGVNDNQIRITVDDVAIADTDSSVPIDGTVFKVLVTATGYNIEAAFPLDMLQVYPSADPEPLLDADGVEIPGSGIAPNNIIGFELQINDNDSAGGRQTMLRWHSDNNDSWDNPSLFGQARLIGTAAGN